MKVVYADGTVGKITEEEGKNLYIHNGYILYPDKFPKYVMWLNKLFRPLNSK